MFGKNSNKFEFSGFMIIIKHFIITTLLLFVYVISFAGCSSNHEVIAAYVTSCTIESDGNVTAIYPMEFSDAYFNYDKAYKNMPTVQISGDASIVLLVDEKCDKLTISEDYYEYRGNAGYISKETYTLTPNNDGNFELKVTHRNSMQNEKAIYFIKTQ